MLYGGDSMHSDGAILTESIEKSFSLRRILYLSIKRIFDIFVGFIGILVLIPLTIIVKIISICNKDYDSIFFKQQRIGKNGKLFTMYKYRTMIVNADEVLLELMKTDTQFRNEYIVNKKVKNDPRITKVGKILRTTSLDEFPQFINVFLGQMSLVGNRPYLPREKEDMGEFYKYIITSKPGITGLWQTNGRSNTTFYNRLILEKKYSRIQSLKLDIKIIFKTILQVIKKDGAN
jgi:undecaprenyl-phosphate galactose phosphotransferase